MRRIHAHKEEHIRREYFSFVARAGRTHIVVVIIAFALFVHSTPTLTNMDEC